MILTFLSVFTSGRCRSKIPSDTHPFQCPVAAYPSRRRPCLCGRTGYCRSSYQGTGSRWSAMGDKQRVAGGSPVLQESEEEEDYPWKGASAQNSIRRGEELSLPWSTAPLKPHLASPDFLAFSITFHPEYHGPSLTSELLAPVLLQKPHSLPPQPICSVRWSLHWIFLASSSHLLWPILLLP